MSVDQESPQLDNKPALIEINESPVKNAIQLLDYGAIEFGTRFQNADANKSTELIKKDKSMEQLTKSVKKWESEEKNSFGEDEERYERESVYANFAFRLDIVTRIAKKDGVQMTEIFDNLRQFVLEQTQVFENLLNHNQTKQLNNQEGIYSYNSNADSMLYETRLVSLWKQYIIAKKCSWPDVLIAECAKILKLLPKAVESFNRLSHSNEKNLFNTSQIIKELFVPKKAI